MFETNSSELNKIWGYTKKIWGLLPPNASPCLLTWAEPSPESLPLGAFTFVQGARQSEDLFLIQSMNSLCRLCKLILNIFPQIPIIGSFFPTKIFAKAQQKELRRKSLLFNWQRLFRDVVMKCKCEKLCRNSESILSFSYENIITEVPRAPLFLQCLKSLQLNNSPRDWARELFKPSTDSANLKAELPEF